MQEKVIITKSAYENLLAHLVDFEERKNNIINSYFPEYNKQRDEFEKLIDNYISTLDSVVKNVSFSEVSENEFPFVCLNSLVEIEDVEENEIFNYMLIEPEAVNTEHDCITILSPMGKALLCKKKGEVFAVNAPSGIYRYRVRSIKLQ